MVQLLKLDKVQEADSNKEGKNQSLKSPAFLLKMIAESLFSGVCISKHK